uniref:Uncharacterized protein n=1 Tax=Panagrolaimus sp. PS1159 TaxID=55785 RepID=A0AC35G9S0_9BILA
MSSFQRVKDLINKFNGNSDPLNPFNQQTTDVRCSVKCETENYSNVSKIRSIQRECLTNDETVVSASAIIVKETAAAVDFKGVEDHEAKARERVEKILEKNEMEFVQAEQAQTDAQIASEKANEKTETALKHQEIGHELLAEAGAKLIEAGAKLQQEEILQTTCISSSAGIEATAAAAHDF